MDVMERVDFHFELLCSEVRVCLTSFNIGVSVGSV